MRAARKGVAVNDWKWLRLLGDLKGQRAAWRFAKTWWPRMRRAFQEIAGLEPQRRRELIGECFRRELLMTIFEAMDPSVAKTQFWLFDNPVDDGYLEDHADSLTWLDLDSSEFHQRFAHARICQWRPLVRAMQIWPQQQLVGHFADYGTYGLEPIEQTRNLYEYCVHVPYVELAENGKLELRNHKETGTVAPGEWLVHDPEDGLRWPAEDTRFTFKTCDNETFRRDYAPTLTSAEVFRRRGLLRAVPNQTGREVQTSSAHGVGYGNPWCWFVAPYDPEHPDDLAQGQRYPVSWWWFDTFLERCSKFMVWLTAPDKA